MQREVAPWSQSHVALHSAACCREIKEGPFTCAVVGLDAGGIPHMDSWAASELHIILTANACIGSAEKNLTASAIQFLFLWFLLDATVFMLVSCI